MFGKQRDFKIHKAACSKKATSSTDSISIVAIISVVTTLHH